LAKEQELLDEISDLDEAEKDEWMQENKRMLAGNANEPEAAGEGEEEEEIDPTVLTL
jgi:hypothetical protein